MHSKSYITVRYAETDKMGIAHHSNYPVWYEVGRTDYIKLHGYCYSELEKAGIMLPVVNLNCHFTKPAQYEDKLLVRTWALSLTAAHIGFNYTVSKIYDDGSQEEIAYGTTDHGIVDSETFRPCNMRKKMPELYEKIKATLR